MKSLWSLFFIAASALFLWGAGEGDSSDGAGNEKVLRVITYNVQFLPPPADSQNERKNPGYRASRIAKEISAYDLVGLQETFHEQYRAQIVEDVRAVWNGVLNSIVSPKPDSFFTNGGCLLLTAQPILSSTATVFENYSKPSDWGLRADGYAAKGVIQARIARSATDTENFVDVFVTHLEARDDSLRPLQYQEAAQFIRKVSDPSRPALFMGDFNTRGTPEYRNNPDFQYNKLISALKEARPESEWIDVWPALHGNERGGTSEQESTDIGKRIDYIFVANPKSAGPRLEPVSVKVELFQDPEVVALSDHNAVAAELRWVIP